MHKLYASYGACSTPRVEEIPYRDQDSICSHRPSALYVGPAAQQGRLNSTLQRSDDCMARNACNKLSTARRAPEPWASKFVNLRLIIRGVDVPTHARSDSNTPDQLVDTGRGCLAIAMEHFMAD